MSEQRRYLRFPASYRIEHWVLMISFTTLAVTGFVQLFAMVRLSQWLVGVLGGIETVRIIHRAAAIVLMLEVVYHIGAVGYRLFVLRYRTSMLPTPEDALNAWQALRFDLGLSQARPQQGRYTFEEKAEYWAVVWGTAIMVMTGFMMWNPIATTRFLPGQFIPAAKAAHGGEALLAVLAIIIWHFYHVHVRHLNKSIFSGYLNQAEMLEEHPIELADIKAGRAHRPLDPEAQASRRRIFLATYAVIASVALVGIYLFATFEETAIETVPPPGEQVRVFAPFTPTPAPSPAPTSSPSGALPMAWDGGFDALFEQKCAACHRTASTTAGLDLTSYEAALQGGNSGPGMVPDDPEGSLIVQRQVTGDHPGQLSGAEIDALKAWIEAGAPQERP